MATQSSFPIFADQGGGMLHVFKIDGSAVTASQSSDGLDGRGAMLATIEQHPDFMGKYGAKMAVGILNGTVAKGKEYLVNLDVIKKK